MLFLRNIIAVLVCSLAMPVVAKINYQIEFIDPQHHLAQVTMQLPKGQTDLLLRMPAWRTGNYKIINQANGIREFKALDSQGQALQWQRADKSSWQVNNPSGQVVTISYLLYANELGRRTRHIDETHAYLDATAVFLYEPSLIQQIHQVNLITPKSWKSYSGLVQTGAHEFVAQNYDQLADSPIESGISQLFEFQADERDYQLVIWGLGNFNGQQIADDLKALAPQSQTIWKGYPYNKYLFIVHATSGASGATEHLNSTVIQRPRFSFAPRSEYLNKFLRTAAHELVHTWNVKAYRPKGLVPYDYQQENQSDLLWVAEGSTSYFQDRLLLGAKLQSVEEFLKELSERINEYQHRPGRDSQSISEASLEKWIAQSGDFANNYSVNIYSEGFMASWLLDFEMLTNSKLAVGYQAVHAALFSKHQIAKQQAMAPSSSTNPLAYDSAMIQQLIFELTKQDYTQWWANNILKPFKIDFDVMLDKAGLRLQTLQDKDYVIWTGFQHTNEEGYITLSQVEKNSPAWQAGLTLNDQLVAINELKVTPADLEHRLKKYQAGDKIELILFRNHQLIRKSMVLARVPKKVRQVELIDSPSNQQKAFFKAWLGVDYPLKNKQ